MPAPWAKGLSSLPNACPARPGLPDPSRGSCHHTLGEPFFPAAPLAKTLFYSKIKRVYEREGRPLWLKHEFGKGSARAKLPLTTQISHGDRAF